MECGDVCVAKAAAPARPLSCRPGIGAWAWELARPGKALARGYCAAKDRQPPDFTSRPFRSAVGARSS
eukprot:2403398-Pyramimonas_sp.AAC.1